MELSKTKEGLEKAEEKLRKKRTLLEKYKTKAEKQKQAILDKGWDPNNKFCLPHEHKDFNECYWAICDYSSTLGNIKNTQKTITEQEAIVGRWKERLEKAQKEESNHNALPEILITVQNNVAEEWNRYDFDRRKRLQEAYKEMDSYRDFIKKYKYAGYQHMHSTDDEIRNENHRAAKRLVLNLWARVKEIIGDVTDTSGLRVVTANELEGIAINGLVKGSNGAAEVESILAGGYNIQKLHIRTIVKESQFPDSRR